MKLLMYVFLLIAHLPAVMANDAVELSTKLSLNGEVVAEPNARFMLNNHFDMVLTNPNGQVRLSIFARDVGRDAIDLRVQLLESAGNGVWTVVGEPKITAAIGGEFSVEARTKAGAGYRLEGTIDRVSPDADTRSGCPSGDSDFLQCSVESWNWLQLASADHSNLLSACCTRNCPQGWTITCCGGCCSDGINCPIGCCPQ